MRDVSALGLLVALTATFTGMLMPTTPPGPSASPPGLVRPALQGLDGPYQTASSDLYDPMLSEMIPSAEIESSRPRPSSSPPSLPAAPTVVALRPRIAATKLKLSGPTELQALQSLKGTHPFMESLTISTQRSVGQCIQSAIGAIAADPTCIDAVLEPLFDAFYDRAADDLHAVLHNLAVLQRAVVAYDLASRVHAQLAAVARRRRYDVQFAALSRHHEQIAARVVSRAYWTATESGPATAETGSEQDADHYVCRLFSDDGRWRRVSVPIQAIVDEALAEAGSDAVHRAGRPMQFDYRPSLFHSEIYAIHGQLMDWIDDLRSVFDSPFLSLYPVSNRKSTYTTKELRDLKDSVTAAAADGDDAAALDQLNLALESGLSDEYAQVRCRDRASVQQADVHQALLQDLVDIQRRLTRARVLLLCRQLVEDGAGTAHAAMVEYAARTLLEDGGAISADRLAADAFAGPALPVLRYVNGAWQAVFIPLHAIVDFAQRMAARYGLQLVVDRDQDGSALFLYLSNPMAGRNLVRRSFMEYFGRPSASRSASV